jgi:hypothetical protein
MFSHTLFLSYAYSYLPMRMLFLSHTHTGLLRFRGDKENRRTLILNQFFTQKTTVLSIKRKGKFVEATSPRPEEVRARQESKHRMPVPRVGNSSVKVRRFLSLSLCVCVRVPSLQTLLYVQIPNSSVDLAKESVSVVEFLLAAGTKLNYLLPMGTHV